jgi:two-component system, sensor histidine kinase
MEEKMKILILDDDEISRFYIKYIYKNIALVDATEDAESAVLKASKIIYDIVILDIGLKGELDGMDVLKQIRKLTGYDRIPFIAFTAFAMAGDREKFLSEGFDDYIAKPIVKEDLFAMVEKNIRKYKEMER